MDDATSACQRAFSFFLAAFSRGAKPRAAPGVLKHGEIRSDVRCAKDRGDRGAAIIEGKNDKPIYRNESGDRRGDELGGVDRGRHGPGVTNAAAVRTPQSAMLIRFSRGRSLATQQSS
jgi:hypothetical protein